MISAAQSGTSRLTGLLRGIVADFQRASGAEIVSLVLYDEEARRYFAPVAVGQPEEDLVDSLADMQAQLGRYLADVAQRKVPEELRVPQYGSTVWLTVTKRALLAADAPSEIDSTFIRRYRVESTVGLPLLAGDRLLGLVYLNFTTPASKDGETSSARFPDAAGVADLERRAARAAIQVRSALAYAERGALQGMGRLSGLLTAPGAQVNADPAALRRQLSIALAELLLAVELDAAIVYESGVSRGRLQLLTAHAPAAAPPSIALPDNPEGREAELSNAVETAMRGSGLVPVATFALGEPAEPDGYLVLLSRDRLARVRWPPPADVLLEAAASLLGGALASRHLVATLANSNRLLGALGGLNAAMLKPGSTRLQVLDAVAAHLTDAAVPEFDFQFATVYVVEETEDSTLAVRMAAGAATSEEIEAALAESESQAGGVRRRVPRWALQQERPLAPRDVLAYVATSRRTVLVGPASQGGDAAPEDLLAGNIPETLHWTRAPVVRGDGAVLGDVPACVIGDDGLEATTSYEAAPFTLAGEIFESGGHGDLIRLFVPFGLEAHGPATGVLEVGYHRSFTRRPDWSQVEALRAAAAQIAAALETARMYEEAHRHAEQMELTAHVSEAIASSIDLEQTLRLVARNLVRLVDASICQIALYEEDGKGWYGAAASEHEEVWRRWRAERAGPSLMFDVLDRGQPVVVEDVRASDMVSDAYVEAFDVRSLMALPLIADGVPIGAAILAQKEHTRPFPMEEVQRAMGLAHQAAVAIKNARLHALAEEERHIQKDFVLIGFGQWGQKAYKHLQLLKQFFNFRLHVVERDDAKSRERMGDKDKEVAANGDALYWDSPAAPAHEQLHRELEPSCYVITYIATPAATHLPTLARYYDLSDVVLIEKPLGAPPEEYRKFLDTASGGVELVAADHYYFKLEVRLLQLLLTEERTLRSFLDSVEEICIEILEAQPLQGAAADIGVVADLIPHALAIVSLFTPIDHIELDSAKPLQVGRHEGMEGPRESYARLNATFPYKNRSVRLIIDVGKGVEDEKWIKLMGERRLHGRSPFYKFDFARGEAIDGTQSTVRAAVRKIREPGVPDNAHLTMLRHVIEKRRPAVGILAIREAIRANVRIRELEALAGDLLARGQVVVYPVGTRPEFDQAPEASQETQPSPPPVIEAVSPARR